MKPRAWIVTLAAACGALLLALVFIAFSSRSGHAVSATPGIAVDEAKRAATVVATDATAHRTLGNSAVDISVAVTAAERDAATTQRVLAQKSNALIGYLKSEGVEHLITTSVSFTPDDRYRKNGPDRTVAYNASMTVSFRTSPDKAADVLAGVLTHGANGISSTVFTPTEQDIAQARSELVAEATRSALAQAESMARATGSHLVSVLSISTQGAPMTTPQPVASMMEDRALAKPAAQPIATAAGDSELSVTVQLSAATAHD